ncbi:protein DETOXIFICATION 44, chloroplastic [Cucurbita pepo subsp. pepo]|uniref:protein DETOXIFICATION 44, chloroplastic n=1 Tax=Cucurbita pepo subsp. pepo TaxID=3664 RepID=UPI000C9D3AD3|nr:protein DETOXIFICATION 44, chloroplastic [Cucurbita pepo subsp. pepo]XP_023543950.1 protein DETOXIFICATION 44, chloroplastic [Cucurbita pepo subsp. pepo]XP_023543951.1 protein DETOXIFICATION 44, chloroplastic [Cucurbita pepo subsp. pepo]
MATGLSIYVPSFNTGTNLSSKCQLLRRNANCQVRFRYFRKASFQKNLTTSSLKSPPEEPKSTASSEQLRRNGPGKKSSNSLLSASVSVPLLNRFRDAVFKFDKLALDILAIALPAALALAADPIASLIDTAFVGHIGSTELAAVGVSASVFNLVSKLFNVPLLNITTSFVAEEQALIHTNEKNTAQINIDGIEENQGKKLLSSVSTSLALAAGLGIAEAVMLSLGSGSLMDIMGIPVGSSMRAPAEQFLSLRAFGAPPIVIALAAQGTFRGFKDTKTPLYATAAGNLLNAVLDPLLIFFCGFGIGGAAIATVISEYLIAFVLLWRLNGEISFTLSSIDGGRIARYLKSGGLLMGRTLAVLVTLTLATSMAAREGTVSMAGYQICVQIWLAISLLTDALALAGQALLASSYTLQDYEHSRQVIYRTLQIGLISGISLSIILFLGFGAFSGLFSADAEVLEIARSGLWFVAGSQPVNALAFVVDGLYYGVSDFGYAAYSMVLVGLISSLYLLVVTPAFGLPGVWSGLFLFMMLRLIAGIWRLGTKSGPWEMVFNDLDEKSD